MDTGDEMALFDREIHLHGHNMCHFLLMHVCLCLSMKACVLLTGMLVKMNCVPEKLMD